MKENTLMLYEKTMLVHKDTQSIVEAKKYYQNEEAMVWKVCTTMHRILTILGEV